MYGNRKGLLKSSLENFKKFEKDFGKVDVIHAHVSYPAGIIAKSISDYVGIPYVITEQMSPFPLLPYQTNKVIKNDMLVAFNNASARISISKALKKKMENFGVTEIEVIPNPIDQNIFKPTKTQTNIEFGKTLNFFTLGRLVQQKGIDILLHAISELPEDLNIEFTIAGDGQESESLINLTNTLKISHKVNWTGALSRKEVIKYFQKSDAFVLPSRHESMGVVFAEAAACGLPAIGTICGGPEEIITKDTGILVQPEDIQGLASAIKQMYYQINSFSPLITREHFMSNFSYQIVGNKVSEVYANVLNNYNSRK